MAETVVKEATGETGSGILWMIGGALGVGALVLFLAPMLSGFMKISLELGLIVVGAALAYLAKGGLRRAGQGAALTGVILLAFNYLMPLVAGLFGGNTNGGNKGSALHAGLA